VPSHWPVASEIVKEENVIMNKKKSMQATGFLFLIKNPFICPCADVHHKVKIG
jgi:hypothetical protein